LCLVLIMHDNKLVWESQVNPAVQVHNTFAQHKVNAIWNCESHYIHIRSELNMIKSTSWGNTRGIWSQLSLRDLNWCAPLRNSMTQVGLGRGSNAIRRASQDRSSQDRGVDSPANVDKLKEYLYSLTEENFNQYGAKFGMMTLAYLTKRPKEMSQVVSLVYEAATTTKETTRLGAMVCKVIIYPENMLPEHDNAAKEFRTKIVELLHKNYEGKKQVRVKSIEMWLAIFSFLSDMFYCMHSPNRKGWNFIGKAILDACRFMLNNDDCDDDEIDCLCQQLKDNGKSLEEVDPTGMECIISELRTRVIMKATTERVRCLCMDLIEYRAHGYNDPGKKLSDFYLVALQDAIANDETQ